MATNVGSIRAEMELDARGFNTDLQKAKQNMSDSAKEAKQVNTSIRNLGRSLMDAGVSSREARKIQAELRNVKPELLEQQLKNVEIQLRRLGAGDEHIAKIKSSMQDAQKETKQANNTMQTLVSTLATVGAGSTLKGLVNTMRTLADEANALMNNYKGLVSVSKSMNVNTDESIELAEKLADRWKLDRGIVADTVKTYLTLGLSLEEIEKLIIGTADAAAYNRQKHLDMGQAIAQVAQGIKAGNSNLTDAAGITTNLSVMYERYAAAIGTTAGKLTEAEKVQAAYNGMMEEAAMFAGNADESMEGYTGATASFSQTITVARQELGEAFMPVIESVLKTIEPIITSFARWAAENPKVVSGIAAATAAILALITVVSALAAAFVVLNAAMGPIGWIILGISALVTGVTAYSMATDAASESTFKFAGSIDELNDKLNQSPLSRTADDIVALREDIENLAPILEKHKQLTEEIQRLQDESATLEINDPKVMQNFHQLTELSDQLKDVNDQLSDMGYNTATEATKSLNAMTFQVKNAIPALVELERQELKEAAAIAQHIDKVTSLRDEYNQLSSVQSKDASTKSKLASVVEQLKREYPGLHAELSAEGEWKIRNIEIMNGYIDAEQNSLDAATKASKGRLEEYRKETEAKLKFARLQIEWMQKAIDVNLSDVPILNMLPEGFTKFIDKNADKYLENIMGKRLDDANKWQLELNEIDKIIASVTTGSFADFNKTVIDPEEPGSTGTKTVTKTKEQLQQEAYQAAMKILQYQRQMGRLSTDEELARLRTLLDKYRDNADIRMDLEVQIYQLEKRLSDDTIKQARDNYQYRTQLLDDLKQDVKSNLREIERAELDSLDRRRKEIENFYDDQQDAIDDQERAEQRKKLLDEEQKYRNATSQEGQKRLNDIREQLRKMDRDDQRRTLDDQKEDELEALDDQRKAVESYYADLEDALAQSVTDMTVIEQLFQDARLSAYEDTNTKIIAEMRRFQSEYGRISSASVTAPQANNDDAIIYQMQANAQAWHSAPAAEQARLEIENERLGASIGAVKSKGAWSRDGMPLFHVGGIAGGMNFSSGSRLLPDEIAAILKRDEYVFTPEQVSSLTSQRPSIVNNYNAPLIAHDGDVNLEDDADIRSYWDERENAIQRLLTAGGDRA